MKRAVLAVLALLLVAGPGHSATGKRSRADIQLLQSSSGVEPALHSGTPALMSPATGGTLQSWNFDLGNGDPTTQGWTSVDLSAQPAYFHIDDFVGLPGMAPLFGAKSLWLGRPACDSPTDCVLQSDGYGNEWEQYFYSQQFTVTGDVHLTFQLHYDSEPSYDQLQLLYAKSDQVLHPLRTWSGAGNESVSVIIPAANLDGKVSFLFKFSSDAVGSDQDGVYNSTGGAAIIDNILISTPTNPSVDSQTFENAADGATYTPDFHWFALGTPSSAGDHAALFDGDNVLQQDPSYTNSTNFWGFFSGSSDNYACGGHPEQLSVPLTQNVDGILRGMYDELQSPPVSLAALPAGHAAVLSFDVYTDITQASYMSFGYAVRSQVGGVWKPWKTGGSFYDPAKAWKTRSFNINSLILPGAANIEVALFARDFCPTFCSPGSPVTCHSHGPLIDNVRVLDGNTLSGNGVVITPVDATTGTSPVSLNFQSILGPGETSLATTSTGPTPSGFTLGDGTYYNISTTATWQGVISVCITYNEAALTVPEASLRLKHWDTTLTTPAWVDITTTLDTVNNKICGTTSSLSPFAIGANKASGVGASPRTFALHQNVPNPFNPATIIAYDVPAGGAKVSIRVYDAAGRLVRSLVEGQRPEGSYTTNWDGRDQSGSAVSSGVYFYKMTAGSFVESRRMVLLK